MATVTFQGHSIAKSSADVDRTGGVAQVPGVGARVPRAERRRQPAHRRLHPARWGGPRDDLDRWYSTFPGWLSAGDQSAGSLSVWQQQMCGDREQLMSRPSCCCATIRATGWPRSSPMRCSRSSPALLSSRASPCCWSSRTPPGDAHCHRVYLLETGRLVASGDAETIAAERHHPQGYLGMTVERFFEAIFLGLSSGPSMRSLVALGLVVNLPGNGAPQPSPRARWHAVATSCGCLNDAGVTLSVRRCCACCSDSGSARRRN